ncbi:MAG: hypothetical protein PHG00_03775 [Methylococcales bacterium]|nr:hypothetical protein [Methylococcales bacterium]
MLSRVQSEQLKSDLILHWVILSIMLVMLAATIIVCQTIGEQLQQPLPEAQRVLIRTILYVTAIVTFPLINLIRYIQLRLNQTMPYSRSKHDPTDIVSKAIAVAKSRYLVTTIVSMALIGSVGVFGFIMFVLGDNFNTLYIFTGLSALGMYLYRPKADEYLRIIEALAAQENKNIS